MVLKKGCTSSVHTGCLRKVMNDKGPHLVICPASLLENWERELQRWCPAMNVVSYYGAQRSDIRYNLEVFRCFPSPLSPVSHPPIQCLQMICPVKK